MKSEKHKCPKWESGKVGKFGFAVKEINILVAKKTAKIFAKYDIVLYLCNKVAIWIKCNEICGPTG